MVIRLFKTPFSLKNVPKSCFVFKSPLKKILFEIISSTLKKQIRCKLYYLLLDSQRTKHAQRSIPLHATPHMGVIKT